MSYIGRGVDAISNVEKLDNITFNGGTTYALTKSSAAFTPVGANNLLVSIDGVIQQGNFSVSTTNIVFDWSPTSSNTCNFILHYGTGVLNVPADGSVSLAKMAANSVDSDQYVDGSIDAVHLSANSVDSDAYVDGSIDTAHIADDQVTLAKMAGLARGKIIYGDASGNPAALTVGSNTQVLKSDGTDISWGADAGFDVSTITGATALGATPADTDEFILSDAGVLKRVDYSFLKSSNTPYFLAYSSADQTGNADNATVDVEFNAEIYDSASAFDTGTYKWTPTTAGYYWIETQVQFNNAGDINEARLYLDVSGTLKFYSVFTNYGEPINNCTLRAGGVYYLSGSNYVDVRAGADTNGTTWNRGGSGTNYMMSYFTGFRLAT